MKKAYMCALSYDFDLDEDPSNGTRIYASLDALKESHECDSYYEIEIKVIGSGKVSED